MRPQSILFVCTGNTCRSPMAAAILLQMLKKERLSGLEVFSRGIAVWGRQPLSDGARDTLKASGIEVEPHESKALTQEDVDRADWILVMTDQHRRGVLSSYPDARNKVWLLGSTDIEDPLGGSPKDFEKCKIDIQNALLEWWPKIKKSRP